MKRKGFTLIELLVVVAIIALLVAILLPSLANARNQAKSVACASNLRSVVSVQYIYASEYNGVVPSYYEYTSPTPGSYAWSQWLTNNGYVNKNNRSILLCSAYVPYTFPTSYGEYSTYGMIRDFSGTVMSEVWLSPHTNQNVFYKIGNAVVNTSNLPLVADTVKIDDSKLQQFYCFWSNDYSSGVHIRLMHPGNKANIGFADGHAEAVTNKDLIKIGFVSGHGWSGF